MATSGAWSIHSNHLSEKINNPWLRSQHFVVTCCQSGTHVPTPVIWVLNLIVPKGATQWNECKDQMWHRTTDTTKLLFLALMIPTRHRLLHQLLQEPEVALDRIASGEHNLERTHILNWVSERRLRLVEFCSGLDMSRGDRWSGFERFVVRGGRSNGRKG